jgi:hypothetical protein
MHYSVSHFVDSPLLQGTHRVLPGLFQITVSLVFPSTSVFHACPTSLCHSIFCHSNEIPKLGRSSFSSQFRGLKDQTVWWWLWQESQWVRHSTVDDIMVDACKTTSLGRSLESGQPCSLKTSYSQVLNQGPMRTTLILSENSIPNDLRTLFIVTAPPPNHLFTLLQWGLSSQHKNTWGSFKPYLSHGAIRKFDSNLVSICFIS